MKTIEERVKQVVAEMLCVAIADCKPETHIVNDLCADSLDEVELVMALEDEFNIEIPDQHAEQNLTIQQMIDYVNDRKDAIDK